MARRTRGRGWESRDAQCPLRGYGLHHVQDGTSECVFCGVNTYGPTTTVGQVESAQAAGFEDEAELSAADIEARLEGCAHSRFTAKQSQDLEFLRWLHVNGRV